VSELIVAPENEMAIAPVHEQLPSTDLRHSMMMMPVEQQNQFLVLYKARRDNFRSWLMSQLIEGVHYGVVPGCEPKSEQRADGTYYGVWNGKKKALDWHHERQWTPKPSLYAAGADFICDILGVRDEYETDAVGWQQMGSKAGNAVVKCKLFSRATGDLIGESLGAYYHQYDPNNALKMASKCAKVGAVINAYDLRDLFTQDAPAQPPHDNPAPNPAAPQEQPRAKRQAPAITKEQCAALLVAWRPHNPEASGDVKKWNERFYAWAAKTAGRQFDASKSANWTQDDFNACDAALSVMEGCK
jgi:hypothetical protein